MTIRRSISLLLALLASLCLSSKCFGQERTKSVRWATRADLYDDRMIVDLAKRISEIELEDISIDGKSIVIGERFTADFRNLHFRIKNISDKPIDFVQITVLLPEIKHSPQIALLRMQPEKEGRLQPDQETEIGVRAGKHYDWVTRLVSVRGREPERITEVVIYMVQFGSQEGFYGRGGSMKVRDSRNECPARQP